MDHTPALRRPRPEPDSRPRAAPSILVGRGLVTLRGLALSNVLLALDYDGILAPAASVSAVTPMSGETRRLLVRVCQRYPTVVMSERALPDLIRQLDGVPWCSHRALPKVSSLGGSHSISLMACNQRRKGIVLQEAREQFACDTAIYVGASDSDEDAFGSGSPGELLGIRVGRVSRTRARFILEHQGQIDALLRALLVARDERRVRKHGLV